MAASLVCKNNGCGMTFVEADNSDIACRYHPKAPVFHEGLKGWSCCSKRVVGFDEFLKIPGCTMGRHSVSNVNPAPSTVAKTEPIALPSSANVGKTEVYTTDEKLPFNDTSTAPVAAIPEKLDKPVVPKEEELGDDPADVIQVGERCKRPGCGYLFKSDQISRGNGEESVCCFHSGVAVFHEGSKGWSCCSRKVLEFDEFLKIKGCKTGKHRFIDRNEFVDCRYDFFQSPDTVTLSIYAKKVDPANASIKFEDRKLLVDLVLPGAKKFRLHTDLFQPVIVDECSFRVLGTKVEIVLRKSNGISWPALEPKSNITSWTTFGIHGKTGTVGGKEMFLSEDSPIVALKEQLLQ